MSTSLPGGTYQLSDDLTLTRMGYGAMQLAGPGVFGPPRNRDEAIAVLRAVAEYGITHIDTSDYYGPVVTNELIREALFPYPESLHIVTKVGGRRDERGGWLPAMSPDELRSAVHDNLSHLGLEALDVVNLRLFESGPGGLADTFGTLVQLQRDGLIRHLGLSNATRAQVGEAQTMAPVVCVQNYYNVARRDDDDLIDSLNASGIAYVPFFPLGGFSPLQSEELQRVADRLETTPLSVALAWLLQRSPNVLLIPGTSSLAHLRENIEGAHLELSGDDLAELDRISG
ncbi:MAG TPA: oxidoreductase [Acidimicrobiales bacterium]|nr:oxidoreductase [Acidimicrobiales bacterium]